MLSKKLEQALNEHLNAEFYSAYLYLSMAADCEAKDLPGFATWMKAQTLEETGHGYKFYQYIIDRDGTVELGAVEKPQTTWKDPAAIFEAVLEHEQLVTSKIHALVDLALEERDHATHGFLQWFVTEQVEEEAVARDILARVRRVQDDARGLMMLEKDLGARALPTLPPPDAE